MEKVGEVLQEHRGKCMCDVVIDQILGLHCIEVDSCDCCYQMSDVKAKMHEIRFQLGLGPYTAGEAYSASQTP